jgi:hypothetical protein
MGAEERPVEATDGPAGGAPPAWPCRADRDGDRSLKRIAAHRSQNSRERIGARALHDVFELGVPENGEEVGAEGQLRPPSVAVCGRLVFNDRQVAVRVPSGNGARDQVCNVFVSLEP